MYYEVKNTYCREAEGIWQGDSRNRIMDVNTYYFVCYYIVLMHDGGYGS